MPATRRDQSRRDQAAPKQVEPGPVSSEKTSAKKMTVNAMYQEVMIQFAIGSDPSRDGADRVADIDEKEQHEQRNKCEPHPQAGREEHDHRGQRRKLRTGWVRCTRSRRLLQPAHNSRALERGNIRGLRR